MKAETELAVLVRKPGETVEDFAAREGLTREETQRWLRMQA